MASLKLFIFSCEEQHQTRAPWALHAAASCRDKTWLSLKRAAMKQCPGAPKVLKLWQGKVLPLWRTEQSGHTTVGNRREQTEHLHMPSTRATFCWMGSRDRHRLPVRHHLRGRTVPGQAAGNWSPSREVSRHVLLHTSSEGYKNKGDA